MDESRSGRGAFFGRRHGHKLSPRQAGLFETFPLPRLFGAVFLTTATSALILAVLVKPIRRLMSGVH